MRAPAIVLLGAADRRYLSAAAGRGLTVLLVDPDGPAGTRAEAARLEPLRITEIVDRAADWAGRYSIRGVCALQGAYVDAAAMVADLLGLPSPGLRAAGACLHEGLRRHYLAALSPRAEVGAAGPAYTMDCLVLRGEIRRLDICPAPSPADRQSLTATHTAILARLGFGTGTAHARYRLISGRPVLIGLAAHPRADAAPDEVIDLCLGLPAPARG
jgi:hypothetical protein